MCVRVGVSAAVHAGRSTNVFVNTHIRARAHKHTAARARARRVAAEKRLRVHMHGYAPVSVPERRCSRTGAACTRAAIFEGAHACLVMNS
eukprot:6205407-Pleurochrysis_carterae.AAC.3